MRLLDPNLLTSETGKILVRDNAIVFSMEHVRCIITADCVIIPQTGFEQSSLSMRFAGMLEEAIIEASQEKEVCVQGYLSLPVTTCYCLYCKSPAKPHTGHYSWQQSLLSMPACCQQRASRLLTGPACMMELSRCCINQLLHLVIANHTCIHCCRPG